MATSIANPPLDEAVRVDGPNGSQSGPAITPLASKNPYAAARPDDPFLSTPSGNNNNNPPQRFSHFDTQMFSLDSASSPAQAKRALEAHLTETDRRIQDASKLGTTLVQQRKDLSARLKDVEKQQRDGQIGPELRQKLIDLEKEYNEVGRESARAFLGPKSTVTGHDGTPASPFKGSGRPPSPTKYAGDATDSPSKLTVPSRRARNQPANGVHDSEFYAEISTSLLSQVRNLQAVLAEKEEALKAVNLEKLRLEVEAEGLTQRLRTLDESEQRYKDENWNLETQTHEFIAAAKLAADREQKLNQGLSTVTAEKNSIQKELDELKQLNGKLTEEHSTVKKHAEVELSGLRRNLNLVETERGAMQRKIEELNAQNQDLAKAVAGRMRHDEVGQYEESGEEKDDMLADTTTPEHSPPPSPSKGTPRHSLLESETLKSSLHHAHRMIQNLKGNIHREKTEKVELKRMLQEARDELEMRRGDGLGGPNSTGKRRKGPAEKDVFKKPPKPNLLGAGRNSTNEVLLEEAGWEDHNGEHSPSRGRFSRSRTMRTGDASNVSETGNEGSDAFETANEREGSTTETDAFQTGAESMAGDSSDELTETEAGLTRGGTLRPKQAASNAALFKPGNRASFHSTASTSAEEEEGDDVVKTPSQSGPRYRVKLNKGAARRSRAFGEPSTFEDSPYNAKDSPASFMSGSSPPVQPSQSLFAELGDLNGEDSEDGEEIGDGTPTRSSVMSKVSSASSRPGTAKNPNTSSVMLRPLKVDTRDAGVMTEPWTPSTSVAHAAAPVAAGTMAGGLLGGAAVLMKDQASGDSRPTSSIATDPRLSRISNGTQPSPAPTPDRLQARDQQSRFSASTTGEDQACSVSSAGDMEPDQARAIPFQVSDIQSLHTTPVKPVQASAQTPVAAPVQKLAFSAIQSLATEPITPVPTPKRTDSIGGISTESGAEPSKTQPSQSGILGSVFRWGKQAKSQPQLAEELPRKDSVDQIEPTKSDGRVPFKDLATNIGARDLEGKNARPTSKPSKVDTTDQAAQTMLSSEQLDSMMKDASKRPLANPFEDGRKHSPASPKGSLSGMPLQPALRVHRSSESMGSMTGRPRWKMPEPTSNREDAAALKGLKRPGSSGSARNSSGNHPPLPPDHKQAIAAAAQRVSSDQSGLMGPPALPASMSRVSQQKRPQTPSSHHGQLSPGSRGGTTPRARAGSIQARSDVSSPLGTRRSSVSSFASELDERFNIRTDGMMPRGFDTANTDPRMIQAITQTMIGEYLWKYTRKAGRSSETSDKRHRRFFWVHPYTRTLYWSDRDPAKGGKAQQKAKSVAIEGVRVVSDDNPMPPGLHRKSIVVMTPGRSIKFTATTGQRHETWFNALSYLLLRTGAENGVQTYDHDQNQALTTAELDEFNPSSFSGRRGRGAASLSSYNSRTTRNTVGASPSRSHSRASTRMSASPYEIPSVTPATRVPASHSRAQTASMSSRLSNYFKPGNAAGVRGSVSSRFSTNTAAGRARGEGDGSIYNASIVHDSAEDLREALAQQDRDSERLENVRACCDGKHDVGSLTHGVKGKHKHASMTSRHSRAGSTHRNRDSHHPQQLARPAQQQQAQTPSTMSPTSPETGNGEASRPPPQEMPATQS